jgi:peptidoglycan hydrolase-like protein with peptidoglycan-binding domain
MLDVGILYLFSDILSNGSPVMNQNIREQIQDANVQHITNGAVTMEQYYASQNQKYQPGTYPQLKRSSLSNIPIYENIDGYPDVVTHQMISIQQQQLQQQHNHH